MKTINERIREMRIQRGMTLYEVAQALGVRDATIFRYESGAIKNIKHETIVKFANLFGCSPAYLMGWGDTTTLKDDEIKEYCEQLQNRPEMRMWFKVTEHASKEDVEKAVKIVEAFLNKS